MRRIIVQELIRAGGVFILLRSSSSGRSFRKKPGCRKIARNCSETLFVSFG